jgi:hypothetical protein
MHNQHKRLSSWAVLTMAACTAIPASATTVYTITGTEQFGTTNLSTGVFTSLGTTEVGATPVLLAGLGEVGGALYGAADGSNALYQISPANGNLTLIGTENIFSYLDFGSTLTTLYAMDSSANLYSVNPSTGAVTLIGSTGLVEPGTSSSSTNSSTLYFAEFNSGYQLYTINTTTGAVTQSQPVTGTTSNIGGFAPIPTTSSTPEPGTWSLFAAGIALLTILKRRAGGSFTEQELTGERRVGVRFVASYTCEVCHAQVCFPPRHWSFRSWVARPRSTKWTRSII